MVDVKPLFRWAGSKRKQVPRLSTFWSPKFLRYVEPFAGSSCLFFSLRPKSALLGDKNHQLIETYSTVRDAPEEIFSRLQRIPRTSKRYYKLRGIDPQSLSCVDRAVRFLFLNRNCFNGIFRTNLQGKFNVPFASSRVSPYLTRAEFMATAALLKTAEIRAWDFGTTLRYVRTGDFVYLDPPYAVDSRRVFREYGSEPFDQSDLDRLRYHLGQIDARGAKFVVSYADCREARQLGGMWHCRKTRVRRHIAGFANARRIAFELLISNFEPSTDV
jgi:DNA adenine methylase